MQPAGPAPTMTTLRAREDEPTIDAEEKEGQAPRRVSFDLPRKRAELVTETDARMSCSHFAAESSPSRRSSGRGRPCSLQDRRQR
jgi:hypothetical protein